MGQNILNHYLKINIIGSSPSRPAFWDPPHFSSTSIVALIA